jgi:selenocysteine lyase/cysteine desulfurase
MGAGNSHFDVNVRDLDCDFYALAVIRCGATGLVLYGRSTSQQCLIVGGNDTPVTTRLTNQVPYKFEAGTPHRGVRFV